MLHFERVFRLGDRLVAGGFEQAESGAIGGAVWDSEDGRTWPRPTAPGEWWLNGYAVVGRTMFAHEPDTPGAGTVLWASEDLEEWRVIGPSSGEGGHFTWRGLVAASERGLLALGSLGDDDPERAELSLWESTDGTSWVRVLEGEQLEFVIAAPSDDGWFVYQNRGEAATVRKGWISGGCELMHQMQLASLCWH